jgi:hypothetical protein
MYVYPFLDSAEIKRRVRCVDKPEYRRTILRTVTIISTNDGALSNGNLPELPLTHHLHAVTGPRPGMEIDAAVESVLLVGESYHGLRGKGGLVAGISSGPIAKRP